MGYRAAEAPKNRRVGLATDRKNEDLILGSTARRRMHATLEDQRRNVTLVAWMIRTHLSYAADLTFAAATGDDGLDHELDAFIEECAHSPNFEATGRHNARQGFRLLETAALVGGDSFLVKLRSGQVQGLESDRIANPSGQTADRPMPESLRQLPMVHGVIRSEWGAPRWYCVCKRDGSRLIFDRMVRAGDVIAHGFYDRWDQGRGVSPLAAAVNSVADYSETLEYAALKAKAHAILTFAATREVGDPPGKFGEAETGSAEQPDYEMDLGGGRTAKAVNLDPGDKIEVIESHHPSFEYQGFTEIEVRSIMLALDFPFVFFDHRKGSYIIHRAAKNGYMRSVNANHRQRNIQSRNRWAVWRFDRAIEDGKLKLPRGKTLADLKWEWQPTGEVWLDAMREIMAAGEAIRLGLTSPQRICAERGLRFERVVREWSAAWKLMRELDLPLDAYSKPADAAQAVEVFGEDIDKGGNE